ncbi:unnamed protein product [Gongylonema pulchrum]|uniref:Peptidase_M13_N domain-containing protein n=1 Tax=Gongylonema pulchrum TaxID=637853 RepID=A0A183D5M8_9BILA|nr:unnamed protein product [Gongylonema pulchrum]
MPCFLAFFLEASLQANYLKALNLIIDGHNHEALTTMEDLLTHPILQKFKVDVNSFNWNEAKEKARENPRVSAMARLFSSLHFNIARLVGDPIEHLLNVDEYV